MSSKIFKFITKITEFALAEPLRRRERRGEG